MFGMSVNLEQAAWYIERDGARFARCEERLGEMHYRFEGTAAGGTYGFWVPERYIAELDERRDRVAARLRARRSWKR